MAATPDLRLVAPDDAAPPDSAAVRDGVICVSGLTKLYEPTPRWMRPFVRSHIRQPVQALDGVDLVVRAGEICAVVGPNGAGKTTLFRILVGLTSGSTGSATVLGLDVEHESEAVRQVTGWMPSEDRSLLMRATCKENLHMHGRLQGLTAKELATRIPEMLAVVGLAQQHDSIVASLSAGMRARLRLARALLPEPGVLLLDEPTGAIDPIAAHALLELITDLTRDLGLAVLLSSHRLEEIEALQSYALLLDRGRVRYSGELDRLRDSLERPLLEIEFSGTAAATRVAATLVSVGVELEVEEATVRFSVESRGGVGALLAALERRDQREVRRIRELPMPLRDLIARMYSAERGGREGLMNANTRVAFRRRPRLRKLYDTFSAYLRMDIIEDRMFPLSTALRYIAVLVPVVMYFFQADYLGTQSQYAVTLVGISCAAGLQDALTGFTSRLQFAQERGTLETYLVEPVSWRLIPVAMNVWRSVTGVLVSIAMLLLGCLLGADIELSRLPVFILILALGMVACNAVGVFAASFLVLFKRGEPVITIYGLAAAFLGGSLFAITVLPGWIRWASYLVPHAYVISAARSVLVSNPPPGGIGPVAACVALVVFSVVAFTLGLKLFHHTLQFARRSGLLST